MPNTNMYDAIPKPISELGMRQYLCASCLLPRLAAKLYWTFWRTQSGRMIHPLFKDNPDPNYGFICESCRQTNDTLESGFVPTYPLLDVINMVRAR